MGEYQDEEMRVDDAALAYRHFMDVLGIPKHEGTEQTPLRVARMFCEEFSNFRASPPRMTLFPANGYDEYVAVKDIQFHSLCEHHHLPFSGKASIAYHPNEYLIGLSKIPRVVRHFAGKPCLQEYLTKEIAEFLYETLKPYVLMVVLSAEHSCMHCRGVLDPSAFMVTSKLLHQPNVAFDKQELLALMGVGR